MAAQYGTAGNYPNTSTEIVGTWADIAAEYSSGIV